MDKLKKITCFFAVIYVVVYIVYLCWRVTVLNFDYPFFSILYLLADTIGFILGLALIISSGWRAPELKQASFPNNLSVDVFVPVYQEPPSIIRKTLSAACAISYPHKTFVLDDGKRNDVMMLAEEFGVVYLCRGDNSGAKAGNLNFGLLHSHAEYLMVLDADHIALPNAITNLIGYFKNDRVALVQTPQDYYNKDAFPYMSLCRGGRVWHDHAFFFNEVQTSGNAINVSTCVGTGVLYRRSAIDKIGGFPTETVTEDFHTSLKLHKLGYQTIYVNEPVAFGLDAHDLGEYYKTRHRWLHGNLHALVKENILFCPGLTFHQRLHYLCLGIIFLEGWQSMLLALVPVIALITGIQPFVITIKNVLIILLFPILAYLIIAILGKGYIRFWPGEIFAFARWPFYVRATSALFGRRMKWRSSKKQAGKGSNSRFLIPQFSLVTIGIFSLITGLVRLHGDYNAGPIFEFFVSLFTDQVTSVELDATLPKGYTIDLIVIAGAWVVYNTIRFWALFIKAYAKQC